jgi:uncharacterized membrane protein
MAVATGLGALMGKLTGTGIDRALRHQARDLVKPGTSATFLVLETVTPGQGGGEVRDPAARAPRSRRL